ncbi:hypothetical protein QVD99_001585 [Batrachochytrium dendrobatidis]|nr:hypothetical protein O5D80_000232 [Batrachochytrium dendrobatidis]KAK5671750.1 hypothetical protein QVD99_001585 [Batrachochytrium dendrobatidis]
MAAISEDIANSSIPPPTQALIDKADLETGSVFAIDPVQPRILPQYIPLSKHNSSNTQEIFIDSILKQDIQNSTGETPSNFIVSTPSLSSNTLPSQGSAATNTQDPFADLSTYITELIEKTSSTESTLSNVAVNGLEGTTKLSYAIQEILIQSGQTKEKLNISTKAQFIRLEKQLVDINQCCQLLKTHLHDLNATRIDILGRLVTPSTMDRITNMKSTVKVILPYQRHEQSGGHSNHGSIAPQTRASVAVTSLDSQESDAFLDMGIFPKTGLAAANHVSMAPVAPKMFAKLPKEVTDANLPKPELMRLSALYELIETEADYCRDLMTMINFHRAQLRESKIVSEQDSTALFSNIDQLLLANQGLLAKLKARRDLNPIVQEIGDVIADSANALKVYSIYAANYPAAMKLAYSLQGRPEVKEMMQKWMNNPEVRGLSLESFLIKPVQRICKYPLLLRELEKHTERAGNTVDQANLRAAAEKIEAVVTLVNEATRTAEEKQRILNLESNIESPIPLGFADKKHIKDGPLLRLAGGKTKERYVLLFTDMLLICKSQKSPGKYELESGYSLAELLPRQEFKDTVKSRGINIVTLSVITSDDKDTIVFASSNDEDRLKWIDAFTVAFKDITEEHRSAVRSTMNSNMLKQPSFNESGGLTFRATAKKGKGNIGRTIAIGAGSSMLRKQAAARASLMENWMSSPTPNAVVLSEPEIVEVGGEIYKRAFAATGHIYYFSTQTHKSIWKLPDGYTIVENCAVTSANGTEPHNPDLDGNQMAFDIEEEEGMILNLVEGYPMWRCVDRGDGMPYFFNINTQETRWEHPKVLIAEGENTNALA